MTTTTNSPTRSLGMTPKEHARFDSLMSAKVGLPPVPHGALFCLDEHGRHWTCVTEDVAYFELFLAAAGPACAGLEIPPGIFTKGMDCWPDDAETGWVQPVTGDTKKMGRGAPLASRAERRQHQRAHRKLLRAEFPTAIDTDPRDEVAS